MPGTVSTFVRLQLAIVAGAIAVVALPASSFANSSQVPPGLSGANQYTETLPGPGGGEPTSKTGKTAAKPEETLGKEDAEKMEAEGPEGRAAAELAAQTAPESTAEAVPTPVAESSNESGHGDKTKKNKKQHGSKQKSGHNGKHDSGKKADAAATPQGPEQTDPDGSSGVEQVAASLTGSSDSGGMGPLLPILIGVAAISAVAYLARNRSLKSHE
jgi:hypothetical protein